MGCNMMKSLKIKTDNVSYRHEYKYEINQSQMEQLKIQLSSIIQIDSHVGASQRYSIRSLYFDDYSNSCYYDNENGVSPRAKFRIRIYNQSDKSIKLELKRKDYDKTYKQSCSISRENVERLMRGQNLIWEDEMDPLLKKLYILVETRQMRPKVIVEYERTPYVYADGNVRVTLDHNIRTSTSIDRFFEKDVYARPVMPVGRNLLEVKFDEFLPDFIYRTIQSYGLRRTTFSKFYLCRKFGGIV